MRERDLLTHQWTTADFDFTLPDDLIAQRPSARRGQSRLMSLQPKGAPLFNSFEDIIHHFKGDEVLILNDTRVVPARLFGRKSSGGRVEVFFLESLGDDRILAMTRGRLKPGDEVHLPLEATATLLERDEYGRGVFTLALSSSFKEEGITALWTWLEEAGHLPLPPYIQREADEADQERYQTIFAKSPGAVAAPTAGLHFTEDILETLQQRGVSIAYVTLHVGPGTFLPVKSERIEEHIMHSERYSIPLTTQELMRSGRPLVAVGTTVVRALESFALLASEDSKAWGDTAQRSTEIFITPGYQWQMVDGLITNFHLPQSTLLMLVSALAGYERVMMSYQAAVRESLRFYSYGDASVFWRPQGRWTASIK